ncbi:protein shisa-5 isoform X1 [Pristis pectinata]|uniref:protein shisa-5 isoform X1 n=1 Tax=Pristis pectinata TaxID=685728 RepID=UPI00223E71F9|nr:protein shisa-5 isoform X1 [Pristis pectinata]
MAPTRLPITSVLWCFVIFLPLVYGFCDDPDDDAPLCSPQNHFSSFVAIGVSFFGIFLFSLVLCLCCPCCLLYKLARRGRQPVVTSSTTTTVVQSAYPQHQQIPTQGFVPYQGYTPMPVQPGPATSVPYPASSPYPPPYPTPYSGQPPSYQDTVATGAGAPYPVVQPPYNPTAQPPYNPAAQPPYNPAAQPPYNPAAQPPYNPAYGPPEKPH